MVDSGFNCNKIPPPQQGAYQGAFLPDPRYGDRERAKCLFRALPLRTRRRIGRMDYSLAELRCPQKMAIGSLMLEAVAEFS